MGQKKGCLVPITFDLDFLRTLRLWIVTPSFGGMAHVAHDANLIDLTHLLHRYGISHVIKYLPNDSLITRARNNLADQFLHSDYTNESTDFILWFDGDITFTPLDVIAMLQLMQNPLHDILAAPYSRKGIHWDRVAEAARLNWSSSRLASVAGDPNVNFIVHPLDITRPHPLLEAGTGFLLMRRKVLTLYGQHYAADILYRRTPDEASIYGRDTCYNYFHAGIDDDPAIPRAERTYLSEDWWFCRHWIRMGGTIHGCMWIRTGHIGTYTYPMDMPAIAELLAATGGFLHGPTRPSPAMTNTTTIKEDPHAKQASPAVIPAAASATGVALPGALPRGADIRHACAFVTGASLSPGKATVAGDPGPLGG